MLDEHPSTRAFREIAAARWLRRLTGPRNHWRTKTIYYRAVSELLAKGPAQPLTWRTIVEAVRPLGSRTTFYDVTGPRARHPLVGEFAATGETDGLQLALCYRRRKAVDQLIDEAKVWSYWPYRESWVGHRDRVTDVDRPSGDQEATAGADVEPSLGSNLAEWARRHPALAAALDHAPPACAVEDLLLVRSGKLCAIRAYAMLADVIEGALGRGVSENRHTAQYRGGLPGGGMSRVPHHRGPTPIGPPSTRRR